MTNGQAPEPPPELVRAVSTLLYHFAQAKNVSDDDVYAAATLALNKAAAQYMSDLTFAEQHAKPATDDGWLWLGWLSGFEVQPVDQPDPAVGPPLDLYDRSMQLYHRCGWSAPLDDIGLYLGNTAAIALNHVATGCRIVPVRERQADGHWGVSMITTGEFRRRQRDAVSECGPTDAVQLLGKDVITCACGCPWPPGHQLCVCRGLHAGGVTEAPAPDAEPNAALTPPVGHCLRCRAEVQPDGTLTHTPDCPIAKAGRR